MKMGACRGGGGDAGGGVVLVVLVLVGVVFVPVCFAELVDISPYHSTIVAKHNEIRREVGASDMQAMAWDKSLQDQAETWVQYCRYRRAPSYISTCGQNLYYDHKKIGSWLDIYRTIGKTLKRWNTEANYYKYGSNCGSSCSYVQMIWASTNRIGCAMNRCPVLKATGLLYHKTLVACFYAPRGDIMHDFPYSNVGVACSMCPMGMECKGGLCVPGSAVVVKPDVTIYSGGANVLPQTAQGGYKAIGQNVYGRGAAGRSPVVNNVPVRIPQTPLAIQQAIQQNIKYGPEPAPKPSVVNNVPVRIPQTPLAIQQNMKYGPQTARKPAVVNNVPVRIPQTPLAIQQNMKYGPETAPKPAVVNNVPARNPQPENPEAVPYTCFPTIGTTEVHNLLRVTNTLRNTVSCGEVAWSSDLERWARHVIRCDVEYPGPRAAYTNFGKIPSSSPLHDMINDWGREGNDLTRRVTSGGCRTPGDASKCNHFTNMMATSNTRMGCAACQCGFERQITCIYDSK